MCLKFINLFRFLFQDLILDFPGRLVDLELSELPAVNGCQITHPIFPDACNHPKKNRGECDIIHCIQGYIYKNRVRTCEFLEKFDPLQVGSITKNQFERGLWNMGVGKHLSQREFGLICDRYLDPLDTNRVRWRIFADEIDTGNNDLNYIQFIFSFWLTISVKIHFLNYYKLQYLLSKTWRRTHSVLLNHH